MRILNDLPEKPKECKEIIHLLSGGNHGIFCSSAVDCSVYGSSVLWIIIPDDCCDRSPYINLGRSGGRMAVDGLYLVWRGWCTASVYRNSGTVSCQDIPGSKNRPVYLLKDSSKEEQRIMMMPLSQNLRRKSYGQG